MLNKHRPDTFEDLSVFQRLKFLYHLNQRLLSIIPKFQKSHLGKAIGTDLEHLKANEFYRTLSFATDPQNFHIMRSIYQKLNPSNDLIDHFWVILLNCIFLTKL